MLVCIVSYIMLYGSITKESVHLKSHKSPYNQQTSSQHQIAYLSVMDKAC